MTQSGVSQSEEGPLHGRERIQARYWIETAFPLQKAAEIMAGEQSTGTFVRVPGETDELRAAHAAEVERVDELDTVDRPSLPGAGVPKNACAKPLYRRAEVTLSWPVSNMGLSLPNVLATVAGNLFELNAFSGLKLLDVSLPPTFLSRYQGPQFGVAGTRRLSGVFNRPMIGTIIKPSVGLSPQGTAEMVGALVEGGIDFIKDDELQADGPHCPFEQRVAAVMQVINRHAEKAGRKVMYACNLTGEIDEMMHRHDLIEACGGTCAMVSMNSIGLPALVALRRYSRLAIHGHRNGWGMLTRHPLLGIDFKAYQKIWRLAGIDQLHVNGIQNKFWETDDSVVSSIEACLTPMYDHKTVLPVVSSGQWGGQAFETYRRTKTVDLLYMAGGGIMAHPMGAAAGVTALQQAWKAAVGGLSLEEAADQYPEFKRSVEKFG